MSEALDRVNSQRIEREFFITHALLHPEGYNILELIAAGIAFEHIRSLYPLDRVNLIPQATEGVELGATGWPLVEKMEIAMEGWLGALYNALTPANYKRLQASFSIFEEEAPFETLCKVLHADERASKRRQRPRQAVRDSVVSIGDILWLADNWESLPELSHHGAHLCQLLSDVQSVLPRAFNRLAEGDRR